MVREPRHRMVWTSALDVHVHIHEPGHPDVEAYLLLPVEAYRLASTFHKRQDDWLEEHAGEIIGGLIFIRGEKTHHAARVDGPSGLRDLPYDFADLTHWVWSKLRRQRLINIRRSDWYGQHVTERPLWVPLNHAWHWFISNSPIDIPGQDAQDVPGWVQGVHPTYR